MSTFINSFWYTDSEPDYSAYYKFDETSGTTCTDEGSNSWDGTITGATINQTGYLNKCYYYDGVNDYVNIPTVGTIDCFDTFPFSVSFYAKKVSASDSMRVLSSFISGYGGFYVLINGNSNIVCAYGQGGSVSESNRKSFVASVAINDTNWHKISVDFTDFNTITVYVDGTSYSATYSSGGATSYQAVSQIDIMAQRSESQYYEGYVDEMYWYDRALEVSER